jgi:soluble lytic murein transglycosylase-like protein
MAIDPSANGQVSQAHVSLFEAGAIARNRGASLLSGGTSTASFQVPSSQTLARSGAPSRSQSAPRSTNNVAAGKRVAVPHTPVISNSNADPDQWDSLLNRMGQKYNVPPIFLKSVMLIESGGRPDAIGDQGHSVGLFQLHDHGYGAGMGDSRFDPEANADRAARGLAEAWQAGQRAGFTGEEAIRAAYNYSFNPGGGWAYQGDALVGTYNQLLAEQNLPPVS